jgi:hypothetical protein
MEIGNAIFDKCAIFNLYKAQIPFSIFKKDVNPEILAVGHFCYKLRNLEQ